MADSNSQPFDPQIRLCAVQHTTTLKFPSEHLTAAQMLWAPPERSSLSASEAVPLTRTQPRICQLVADALPEFVLEIWSLFVLAASTTMEVSVVITSHMEPDPGLKRT